MNLVYQPSRIPRSTTRAEWRSLWRNKRIIEKRLADMEGAMIESIQQIMLFGTGVVHINAEGKAKAITMDMIERIINPPICIFPDLPEPKR